MADGTLRIYPTNLTLYNDGWSVLECGTWLDLPADPATLDGWIRKHCLTDHHDSAGCPAESVFVTDYEMSDWGVCCGIDAFMREHGSGEYVSVDDWNLLAAIGSQLDDFAQAACDAYISAVELPDTVDRLCSLMVQAADMDLPFFGYEVPEWCSDESPEWKMGYTWASVSGIQDELARLGIDDYFDYEAYGKNIGQDCTLLDEGYLDLARLDVDLDCYDHDDLLGWAGLTRKDDD